LFISVLIKVLFCVIIRQSAQAASRSIADQRFLTFFSRAPSINLTSQWTQKTAIISLPLSCSMVRMKLCFGN